MATYWVKSGTGGTDAGTSWSNAAESIGAVISANAIVSGDIIYVHNTHNATGLGASQLILAPESGSGLCQILCVDGGDATGASLVDGTVGNLATGASEGTANNFSYTLRTNGTDDSLLYVHGLSIRTGVSSTSGTVDILFQTGNGKSVFNQCTFWIDSNNSGANFSLGTSGTLAAADFYNCTFKTSGTGSNFSGNSGLYRFYNCSVDSSGSSPSALFAPTARAFACECTSCDWSHATAVHNQSVAGTYFKAQNCAIGTPVTGTHAGYAGGFAEFMACAPADGANGADILSYYYEDAAGSVQDTQTVYKATSGAQGEQDDGTDTSYSLQMDPSAECGPYVPLYTPWIYTLVGSTGAKTIALKVAHTESAVLTDVDIFMEVQYMGEPGLTGTQRIANSPMSIIEVDDDAPFVATTLARDVIATATNRTDDGLDDWTGLTSEKEHTLTASVTCDEVGYIACRVGLTKNTTNAVYVDPKISVT